MESRDRCVDVVNYSAGDVRRLTALAEVLNIDGSLKWKKGASLDSAEDSVTTIAQMEYQQYGQSL